MLCNDTNLPFYCSFWAHCSMVLANFTDRVAGAARLGSFMDCAWNCLVLKRTYIHIFTARFSMILEGEVVVSGFLSGDII